MMVVIVRTEVQILCLLIGGEKRGKGGETKMGGVNRWGE